MHRNSKHRATGSYSIRINAILLLVLFAYLILMPVLPYLEYMARKDFIIENLCINKNEAEKQCDGLCYLEKQVKKGVEGSENSNLPANPQEEKEEIPDYVMSMILNNINLQVNASAGSVFQGNYAFLYVSVVFHPPMQA